VGDDRRADHANGRIQPGPAIRPRRQKTRDRQHRRQGIGHDVPEGGAQIVIMVVMVIVVVVAVPMPMIVPMIVIVAGNPAARRSEG